MSAPTPANKVKVASISDRGLSEKRPVNEDSFLADPARGFFAVADGVGGAEAGEVASRTAVDVLDEAFRNRLGDEDDAEDLMELAIQRANSSIHQMANEHPRFSMMATTIVALHIDKDRATFGHVGDSRLYCVTPDGKLVRETEDHSIVEEEVRAGRMTREQAANHPSIFAWSVCNESDMSTEGGRAYFKEMKAWVNKLDPSRFVTFADNDISYGADPKKEAANDADFIMMNQYYGAWNGPEDGLVTMRELPPGILYVEIQQPCRRKGGG